MLIFLRKFFWSLLFDEAAAQRYLAVGLYLFGDFLGSGGVIPGTETAVPGLEFLYRFGPLLKAAGLFMGAGSMLPALKAARATDLTEEVPAPKPKKPKGTP